MEEKQKKALIFLFVFIYIVGVIVIPAQYAFCSHPYKPMEGCFLALLMINIFYSMLFALMRHRILPRIKTTHSWLKLIAYAGALFSTIAIVSGKTQNCRDPVLRIVFRVLMSLDVIIIAVFQDLNVKRKTALFGYIFFNEPVQYTTELEVKIANNEDTVAGRFANYRPLFLSLRPIIKINLLFDLVILSIFYVAIIGNPQEFHHSFSLNFTIIVMFCINMFSNILNMVEFNKNIKYVELKTEVRQGMEIQFLGWKPEGDLLVGYAFGLVYLGVDGLVKCLQW